MSTIFVCPLSDLEETLRESGAKNMIAFGAPRSDLPQPDQIERYIAIRFNDIDTPREGLLEPTAKDVGKIIDFAMQWDRRDPVLFQCWMGISRSTAAAAITLATLRPDLSSQTIAARLRKAAPSATPNRLMIELADDLLGLKGQFSQAIAGIGRGETVSQGTPFSLAL